MSEKIEYLISKLAEDYLESVLFRQCGQLYFVADDLGINIDDLDILMNWFGFNEDDFLI